MIFNHLLKDAERVKRRETMASAELVVSFHGMEDYKLRLYALQIAGTYAYEQEVELPGMAELIDISREEWIAERIDEWLEEARGYIDDDAENVDTGGESG